MDHSRMSNPFENRNVSPSAPEPAIASANPFAGRVRAMRVRDRVPRARELWTREDVGWEMDEIDARRSGARADGLSVSKRAGDSDVARSGSEWGVDAIGGV